MPTSILATFGQGLALGLSTGLTCLATCAPIYLPYILAQKKGLAKSTGVVLEISAGRFFSYLAFGALAGWLGGHIGAANRTLYTGVAYILLSVFLLAFSWRQHRREKSCAYAKAADITGSPFLLGIITGINFCPSFLLALSAAVAAGGACGGLVLFAGFFAGTTAFLLPLAAGGMMTGLHKVRLVARWLAVAVATVFLGWGCWQVYTYFRPPLPVQTSAQAKFIDPTSYQRAIIVCPDSNGVYWQSLAAELYKNYRVSFYKMQAAEDTTALYFVSLPAGLTPQNSPWFGVEQGAVTDSISSMINSKAFIQREGSLYDFTK